MVDWFHWVETLDSPKENGDYTDRETLDKFMNVFCSFDSLHELSQKPS